ncbi:MAG: AAA family ATPase [Conexivisphaera sp.]
MRLRIRNFRGIGEGELDLPRVSLLMGPNNAGKTTVLEAIYLLLSPAYFGTVYGLSPIKVLRSLRSLGTEQGAAASLLRYYVEREAVVEVEGIGKLAIFRKDSILRFCYRWARGVEDRTSSTAWPSECGGCSLCLYMDPNGNVGQHYEQGSPGFPAGEPLLFAPSLVEAAYGVLTRRWQDLANSGATSRIAEELSDLLDGAQDLTYEPYQGGQAVYAYLRNRRRVRLADMGEGAKAYLLVRALQEILRPRFMLWDDVEAHMNPRLALRAARWIAGLGETSVIMTTHSLEFAEVIAGAAEGRVILLALRDGRLSSRSFTAEELGELRTAGVDVRLAEGLLF